MTEHGRYPADRMIGGKSTYVLALSFDGMEKLTSAERRSLNEALAQALEKSRKLASCFQVRMELER